jgi:thymidylate synthase/dihydrofolate reductase
MGRNTFNSMKQLKGRLNIVLTKQNDEPNDNKELKFVNSLESAFKLATGKIFIIGGLEIFNLLKFQDECGRSYMDNCEIIYKTTVKGLMLADKFFTGFDTSNFVLSSWQINSNDKYEWKYEVYKRNVSFEQSVHLIHNTNTEELEYLKLLTRASQGQIRSNRTGINTRGIFGEMLSFDLSRGFPLLTTRKLFLRGIFEELMWFIRGQTDSKILESKGVNIWKGNSSREFLDTVGLTELPEGCIGKGYGYQWRNLKVDQLRNVINLLKTDPYSRRILVNSWNVDQLSEMSLPPCHYSFQFWVDETETQKYRLNCIFNMRSCDLFHGLPFNIASYALLTHLVALECGMEVGILKCCLADCHVYTTHLDAVNELISRKPNYFPSIEITRQNHIEDYVFNDIKLIDYNPHPAIKCDMVV